MKARLLKKLLNNTDYTVHSTKELICVGSSYVSELINVNKKTLVIKYALDTFNEGRKCLEKKDSTELLFIFDKLHELVKSGEIHSIINGDDIIENPLIVYSIDGGELIESQTDEYGWPNVTSSGQLMYQNEYFKDKIKALKYGICSKESSIEHLKDRVVEADEKLVKFKNWLGTSKDDLRCLNNLLYAEELK